MTIGRMSYAELIAYAAGEVDDSSAQEISEYLKTHGEDAALVARFHVLTDIVRYLARWQPPEVQLARAKSLYRMTGYRL